MQSYVKKTRKRKRLFGLADVWTDTNYEGRSVSMVTEPPEVCLYHIYLFSSVSHRNTLKCLSGSFHAFVCVLRSWRRFFLNCWTIIRFILFSVWCFTESVRTVHSSGNGWKKREKFCAAAFCKHQSIVMVTHEATFARIFKPVNVIQCGWCWILTVVKSIPIFCLCEEELEKKSSIEIPAVTDKNSLQQKRHFKDIKVFLLAALNWLQYLFPSSVSQKRAEKTLCSVGDFRFSPQCGAVCSPDPTDLPETQVHIITN